MNRNKGWERREGLGASTWYVFEGNWAHAIKGQRRVYQLPGDPTCYSTLALAKEVSIKRIKTGEAQRKEWARRRVQSLGSNA